MLLSKLTAPPRGRQPGAASSTYPRTRTLGCLRAAAHLISQKKGRCSLTARPGKFIGNQMCPAPVLVI